MRRASCLAFVTLLTALSACSDNVGCIEPAFGPTTLAVVGPEGRLAVIQNLDEIRAMEKIIGRPARKVAQPSHRILISDGRTVHSRWQLSPAPGSTLAAELTKRLSKHDDLALITLAEGGDPELAGLARDAMERARSKPPATAAPSKP